jgi:selenocysteine-specific elongation factor
VRGLQTHQHREEIALPGTRVAVNLAGVSHHDIARGDLLALPSQLRPTDLLDVRLRLLPEAPGPLEQNMRLDLFVGAAEVPCRVTLLDRTEIAPGEIGWLQLRLERPIAVARGDRYILRQPSPSRTLGGGRVVDTQPPRHRRFRPEVIAALESLARGTPADLLRRALADGQPQAWAALLKASGLAPATAIDALSELIGMGEAMILETKESRMEDGGSILHPPSSAPSAWVISAAGWAALTDKLATALGAYHRRYPLRAGMPREELRSRLKLSGEGLDAVLGAAAEQISIHAGSVRLATHRPTLTAGQQRATQQLLAAFATTPNSPPALDLDPELLGWLIEQGTLVRVSDDVAFLSTTYRAMVAWVRDQISAAGSLTVAQFRDQFGSSRKYALALLEHLDERKITRRTGDARTLY